MTTQGKSLYVYKPHETTKYEAAAARPWVARRLPRMTESEAGLELAHALQLIDMMRKEAEIAGTFRKTALLAEARKAQAEAYNMREAIRAFAERVSTQRKHNPRRVPRWIVEALEDVLYSADLRSSGGCHD